MGNGGLVYLSGEYLWCGLGDPDTALYVWEGLAHAKSHKDTPKDRSPIGELFEKSIRENKLSPDHQNVFDELTTPEMMTEIKHLVAFASRNKELLKYCMNNPLHPLCETFRNVMQHLYDRRLVLSHNQFTESTFRDLDIIRKSHTGLISSSKKGNKTTGSSLPLNTVNGLMSVKQEYSRCKRVVLERENAKRNTNLKSLQKNDLIAQALTDFVAFAPSAAEMNKILEHSNVKEHDAFVPLQPDLEQKPRVGRKKAMMSRGTLVSLAREIAVAQEQKNPCLGENCTFNDKGPRKGRVALVECRFCETRFHKECLEQAGLIENKQKIWHCQDCEDGKLPFEGDQDEIHALESEADIDVVSHEGGSDRSDGEDFIPLRIVEDIEPIVRGKRKRPKDKHPDFDYD